MKLQPVSRLRGTLHVPPDKSITHRAIFFASLSKGVSRVKNPLQGEDCLSSLSIVETLGAGVKGADDEWEIEGCGLHGFVPPIKPLDCGNSGTSMRLLSGILAAQPFESTLTGDKSLLSRPMDRVAEPLSAMGAAFEMREGRFAPFNIRGTQELKPLTWTSQISSAQVKSAVLLAGMHAAGRTTFIEPALSRDHTERMLGALGAPIVREGNAVSITGPFEPSARDWMIPGDFSSAAFFLAAGVLFPGAEIVLPRVNLNPSRTGLLSALLKMGAHIESNAGDENGEPVGDLKVCFQQGLRPVSIGRSESAALIDEIPALAVVATQAEGRSEFSGIEELRVKESDRIKSIVENLNSLGARIEEREDGFVIDGPTPLKGGQVKSFGDHRIAMAMAVASLISEKELELEEPACVGVSYPAFWNDLQLLTA